MTYHTHLAALAEAHVRLGKMVEAHLVATVRTPAFQAAWARFCAEAARFFPPKRPRPSRGWRRHVRARKAVGR